MMRDVGFAVFCVGVGLLFGSIAGLSLAWAGSSFLGIKEASGSPLEAQRRDEIDPTGWWFAVRYRRQLWFGLSASVPVMILGVVLSNV